MTAASIVKRTGILLRLVACAAAAAAVGCADDGGVVPVGGSASLSVGSCSAIDAASCSQPLASYATDIAPLLDTNCNRTCHTPGAGPWPLTTYKDVVGWTDVVGSVIERCAMPPPDAGALTPAERETLLNWIACGAPNN